MSLCGAGPVLKNPPANGGGNPFGDFYVGVGNLGFVGGPITEPHGDYQAGDILFCTQHSQSLLGYSALTGNALGWNMFIRVATGTAADNVASFVGGLCRQIYAFRNNASYSRNGSTGPCSVNFTSRTNMPYPACDAIFSEDADIVFYAGQKFIDDPVFVSEGDGDFVKTAERIGGSFLCIIGIAFNLSNPQDILEGDFSYGTSDDAAVDSMVFRNGVNIL